MKSPTSTSPSNPIINLVIGTNRAGSRTGQLASYYGQMLEAEHNAKVQMIDLSAYPAEFISGHLYGPEHEKPETFTSVYQTMSHAQATVWIFPEYNNSFPGVMKAFLDGFPFPNPLAGQRTAMASLSAGTNGGANAMSHWADIVSYLGLWVVPQRLRIGRVQDVWDGTQLTDPSLIKFLKEQMSQLI